MSNELIPSESFGDLAPVNSNFGDLVASDVDFFYRMQLFSSKSNAVQEGKIEAKHYGIPDGEEIIDLGSEVDVVLLAWRPKALDTTEDPPLEVFDVESPTFTDIKLRSSTSDSGCMYGPEFLLWVPSVQRYLTFFMSSKSARREAKKMEPLMRCAATLKSKIIKSAKYIWDAPVVIACSTPLDVPSVDEMKVKIQKFLNPPEQNTELAEDDGRDR